MSQKNKTARRLLTIAMSSALMIGLSSCSGAGNNYGKLDDSTPYASVTANGKEYSVTDKQLWDELKWSAKTVLDTKIEEVILQKYIKNISVVMNKKFSALTDDEKTNLGIETEDDFNMLNKSYSKDLKNYVIKDIYNFIYNTDNDYSSNFEGIKNIERKQSQQQYVDEIYTTYQISKIGNDDLIKIVEDAVDDDSKYLVIANDNTLRSLYYKEYAERLFAMAQIRDDVDEAYEDDDDEEDDVWGYYTTSKFISKFKSEYTNKNDVDAVLIKFSTEDEYNQTLRAFGLKFYNSKLYFIQGDDTVSTYEDYIKYYDDFSNSKLGINEYGSFTVESSPALELYVQIYNYMYSGYRSTLETNVTNTASNSAFKGTTFNVANYSLDTLRDLTADILATYTSQNVTKYTAAVENLKSAYNDKDADTRTIYTSEELADIDSSLKSYLYDTLDANDPSARYSTSTQSANSAYYIAYKLGEEKIADDAENAELLKKYDEWYSKDKTDYEILSYILDTKGQKNGLYIDLENKLIKDDTNEVKIKSYKTEALEDVTVSIYNEAVEIAYAISNSNYSASLFKHSDSNVLAEIKYEDTTYNIDIVANPEDDKALTWPGTDAVFGMYNYLETESGATTAINLISNEIIKDTQAYKDTNEDRKKYEDAVKYILLNFANNGYSSQGYASTIGKYNFLMMYFHTASIDDIVDNYYRVQFASTKLLTDYTNDTLINFFKEYSDEIYKDYFSLTATRLVAYFDADDDGVADTTDASDANNWINRQVQFDINDDGTLETVSMEEVSKKLVYEVYNMLSASTSTHTDYLSTIVSEIQTTAKVIYENNPIANENIWARYRKLGLNVMTEEVTATNSSTDIDFNIKSRLYNYSKGSGKITTASGEIDVNYQYFINDTTPTCYIEPLTSASISKDNNYIVRSNDGYNLLLVTTGTAKASAKWEQKDNDEGILDNITFSYNDKIVTIDNIYNDGDQLNINQIKAYVIDNAVNGSSTMTPSSLSSAYESFLSPVYTRYTSSDTQRIVLLSFIRNNTADKTTSLYDVIKYKNTAYNGTDGVFKKLLESSRNAADSYVSIYTDSTSEFYDPTGTVDQYSNWWSQIETIVNELILTKSEAN